MASELEDVKATLQDMEVHDGWTAGYRTAENDPFYTLAFDAVARAFGPPGPAPVLDAGCGSGTKTLQLARRGYRVMGVDLSQRILESARRNIDRTPFSASVTFRQADLLALAFPYGTFPGVLCWGVLMHVPQLEHAIAELARVTRPGGAIVVSEGNRHSLQAVSLRWLKRGLNRERAEIRDKRSGLELWEETSAGRLVTRQADVRWLVDEFGRHGARLMERRAGQFTEIFTLVPWKPVRGAIHAFNNLWFSWPRWPGLAFGNLLVFQKAH